MPRRVNSRRFSTRPGRQPKAVAVACEPLERRLLMYNTYDGEPKWGFADQTLTYSFTNALDGGLQGTGGPLNLTHIRSAIGEAFAMWAAVIPWTFREVSD